VKHFLSMDTLTQLQEWMGSAAERFYTALGILQRDAAPSNPGTGKLPPHVEQQIRGFGDDILYSQQVLDAVISQVRGRDFFSVFQSVQRSSWLSVASSYSE
jgi:hypothetical protein